MGSLRHGALPQAGAKNESKNTRLTVARQDKNLISQEALKKRLESNMNLEQLKNSRLNAMTDLQKLKAKDNDTTLNFSNVNQKDMFSNLDRSGNSAAGSTIYPKNSLVDENFTVTNPNHPEMNEDAQSFVTLPTILSEEKTKINQKFSGGFGLGRNAWVYKTKRSKGDKSASSNVEVITNPSTNETIGEVEEQKMNSAYNQYAARVKALQDAKNNQN